MPPEYPILSILQKFSNTAAKYGKRRARVRVRLRVRLRRYGKELLIMALSPIDIYRDILPQTNCGDCGYSTCLAFASMVVSEQLPLGNCPHLAADVIERCEKELQQQYANKKWTKRD